LLGLISVTKLSSTKEEQEACLNLMEGRVYSMEQFINEIIDYSRNARQEIKSERIQLRAIAQQVLEELKYIQGIEKVDITLAMDDQLTVDCDRTRLKVVLSNVIGNAIKYRDREKANQQVVISAHHTDNGVEIEVRDNGEGIALEHQSRIFDMFFRASENSQGSGLGLYIVKEAIDKLGGKIEVQSQPRTGTSFFIRLPRTS
jgi:signal transduction histidine kinase